MPRPKQTETEREAMRERILDAAHELLLEHGYDALTTRLIAERLGVSHMVLYTYFENHDALIQALRARLREEREASRAEALRQAETGDVAAVMREALQRYVTMAKEHPKMYSFMWVQPIHADALCSEPHRPYQGNVRYLAQLVQLGIERGVFVPRDPTLTAATVFAIIHAPSIFYHNGRLTDENLRDRMSAESLEIAMNYLLREAWMTNNHPTNAHPTNDYPTNDHPTNAHPTNDYPTNDYPTNDYPTN
ncbi:MAG TPA: TetR/AcrR family transcriptional regulator, partial [Anaerolineae bacterium]|nr:TetR/AcrR family transcriptional regulator [Anaerolineae bacterium]